MIKIISLILLSSIIFSCQKNIEIDKNRIFIKGGIKSELIIRKIKNNNPNDSLSFPHNYSVKEKVRLKIGGNGISMIYENREKKYFKNGEAVSFIDELDFNNKNQYYYWVKEKPIDNIKHKKFPMEFENGYWYSIRDIQFRGSNCYFQFYINKKGEFKYDDIKYINLSPI